MPSTVTQATLDSLARRLDDLAAAFPTTPEAVAVGTLADHVSVLTHHLQYVTERAQDRFIAPERVRLPERQTLSRLAEATVGIAGALNELTEALAHATDGFRKQALPDLALSHLRKDPEIARIIASEKYAEARARLRDTATALRPTPAQDAHPEPRPAALQTRPPAQSPTGPKPRHRAQR
ncbi:hypothetical protein [Streptomyces sp. 769]|uniref:hypothetical protein n=1 Tax=Streptomyces sp. 769 TaxID=1262452 RepID=UPI0005820DC7|nr:hypothetical protein [Streptomyces sp. 769]AJC55062.1 hypothetical protein GZL_02471 [Streptomyces sp. 769]